MNRRGFLSLLGAGAAAVVVAPTLPIASIVDPIAADAAIAAYIELTCKQAAETFSRYMDAVASGNTGLMGLQYYQVRSDGNYMGISRESYPKRYL